MTSPSVTFGGFGSAPSSFSSRTQSAATRVDSAACVDVSKMPIDVMTPSPSIRKYPLNPGSLLRLGMRVSSTFLVNSAVRLWSIPSYRRTVACVMNLLRVEEWNKTRAAVVRGSLANKEKREARRFDEAAHVKNRSSFCLQAP